MTAEVATKVSDFLRDAQARVGELTYQMITLRDEGSTMYARMHEMRKALYDFMKVLNDKYAIFIDSTTTFIQADGLSSRWDPWTDREVVEEIEYLRFSCQLEVLPFFVFVGYYPQIIAELPSSGFVPGTGWTPPLGDYLQILRYDSGGNLIAISWPDYAGMRSLSITDYFAGRA